MPSCTSSLSVASFTIVMVSWDHHHQNLPTIAFSRVEALADAGFPDDESGIEAEVARDDGSVDVVLDDA